jgi:uncharacterized protein
MQRMKQTLLFPLLFLIYSAGYCQVKETSNDTINESKYAYLKSFPKPIGWVNDFDNLYTAEQKRTLDSVIANYEQQTTVEIAVVTLNIPVATEEEFDTLTLRLAKVWGVGKKGKDNGILIGITRQYRMIHIQNGKGIERIISDAETKEIIDNYFIPDFKPGHYYEGTKKGILRIIAVLNSKAENQK